MIILAVESSCDETSIAIMRDAKLISLKTATQIKTHAINGGIVPELASRLHVKNLHYVAREALKDANIDFCDVNKVAYTATPGLLGCLHTGKVFAETVALYYGIPLIPINHLHGHVYAAEINHHMLFPCLSLVVSGGHTILYYLKQPMDFNIIGQTLDDAVGECFDKVGRMLGLPYPAGPDIDALAQQGRAIFPLPIAKTQGDYDFSFSGLKSAARNWLTNYIKRHSEITPQIQKNFCASLQATITKTFKIKLTKALHYFSDVKMITIGGGVAANSGMRTMINDLKIDFPHLKIIIPDLSFCTDNAAMIAQVAQSPITK